MPRSSFDDSSTQSGKSGRSGKSLAERIRELGFNFRNERIYKTLPLQYMNLKLEENRPSDYLIMMPNLNLNRIVYFQPEILYDQDNPEKITYLFETYRKDSADSKQRRISDIEVKSYKPNKTLVFRKRKRHSSIISTVEEILHRNRSPLPSRDVSEESIILPEEKQPEKTIKDLPENILMKIFDYFTLEERNLILALVCKAWYYILEDPKYWTELTFTGSKVCKNIIIRLIKRHLSVRKLHLIAVPEIVDILQELCRCNHSITHLTVKHCVLSSHDFARIILHVISCCTKIEILDLEGMRFQSDRFFLEIGRLKNLKSINLTGNKLIRNQNLITLSVNCRNLQELRILDIFINEHKFPLQDADVIYIVLHLQKNLETLEIDMQKLKNVSYQAILSCSKLQNLILRNCLYLSSETFRQFPDLGNLRKLELTRGINLKSHDFQDVFGSDKLNKIEHLNINGCWRVGETGLEAITHRLRSLKFLSIKNCKTIEESHLSHLSRCPELTHLNISYTAVHLNSPASLQNNVKKLQALVIDSDMVKKSTIQQLKNFYPDLKISISLSEFQTEEMLLQNY